jgi:predicted MFS family arabinose efflux permease
MTDVLVGRRPRTPRVGGYADLARLTGALPFATAALVGRLSTGAVGLAVLLLVQHATGSYSIAGIAVATFGGFAAVLAPLTAGWVHRRGLRHTLPVLGLCHAAVMTVLGLAGETLGPSPVVLVALCALAGSLAPPLGPTSRHVWAALIDDRDLLRKAYGLDAAADELLFTAGPVVTGAVVALAGTQAGVLLCAALVVTGTAGMVASPLSRSVGPTTAAPVVRPTRGRPFRAPGLRKLMLVMFAVGTGLGGIEMAAVGFAQLNADAVDAGPLLATIALGCATGGILYGSVRWRRTVRTQLAILCATLTCALLGGYAAASTLPLLVVAMFLAGLVVAPALVAGYTVADRIADPAARSAARTLVTTVNNLGTAAGTAVAGVILDHAGLGVALLACAAGTAVIAAFAAPRSRRDLSGTRSTPARSPRTSPAPTSTRGSLLRSGRVASSRRSRPGCGAGRARGTGGGAPGA